MLCCGLQSRYLANRLDRGPQFAEARCAVAVVAAGVGWRGMSDRLLADARAAAAESGDPRLIAHTAWFRAVAHDLMPPMSAKTGQEIGEILDRHTRWLDTSDYITALGALGYIGLIRGYTYDLDRWYQQALIRSHAVGEELCNVAELGAQAAALAGQHRQAAARLTQARNMLATMPDNFTQAMNVAISALVLAVEQGETGEVLETAVTECAALRLKPANMWSHDRLYWVYLAFGRLAQAATDGSTQRLAAAAGAIKELRRAASGPILKGYLYAAEASLRQLRGDHLGALKRLARLETVTGRLDLPLLGYETARVRARAYHALDAEADARRQAENALLLATSHGWHTRARWIRVEFNLEASPSMMFSARQAALGTRSAVGARIAGSGDLHSRHLHSLHQVSLAAASVLDPDQLARVALDEVLQIFAAERAFLFLCTGDSDELAPYLGRASTGGELSELAGYGSTLVERVRETGEALVVTGSEEGAALGSQSAVVHGLRSIMVAPLQLKRRLLGVVYLDSRAAKGIFTADDVEILATLTNHIALSLETARTAQLELAVHAAQQQRDLAELLRRGMTDMAATLEPEQVIAQLVEVVARVLPVRRAVMLHRPSQLDDLTVLPAPPLPLNLAADAALPALLTQTAPQYGVTADKPGPLREFLDATAWLAIPLVVRGEHRGLLVAGLDREPTTAEVEIAATVAGQGMAALDNALLFRQIEQLAVRDGLTSLYNRRHFVRLAHDGLAAHPTCSAIMADIDHFKRVNDTHGHGVGDEVIREVAHRMAGALRPQDVICRYGGEEFAILLPGADVEQALAIARRLHAAVCGEPIETQIGPLPVTVSVGLAGRYPQTANIDTLLGEADEALYAAKRNGRNQVATAAGG
jgi:diguanylate cyclase (GGDEF)-like protein